MSRRVWTAWIAAAWVFAAGCTKPVQSDGRNLLLVTFETTRADHIGAYGYERDTSPAFDRLALRGVLFESMSSVSPRTNPSLASLMTGRYPHEHGVRNLLLPLEREHRTLAEVLRDAGYRTGAIQTHPRLVRGSGLEQGFQHYDDDVASHPVAMDAIDSAHDWIRENTSEDRPWFLWLHLMDPHWTYDPPAEWRQTFAPEHPLPSEIYRALSERRITIGPIIHRNRMSPAERQGFVDLYDAEIRYTDHALGELLERLRSDGLLERTLVAVTADHGESLGENDYFFEHGAYGGEAEISVPFVIAGGDDLPRGARIPWSVSSIDIAPTLVDLLRAPSEGVFRGHSLRSMIEGTETEHRACFGESGKVFHEEVARRPVAGIEGKWRWLRRGPYKLSHRPRPDGGADRVLFDLSTDPEESTNVAERFPEVTVRLSSELDALLDEDVAPAREYHISPEAEEMLRSLGYVN